MPIRICKATVDGHGCPNVATYKGRCPEHARERERVTHGNKHIYNTKRWLMLRRRVLFEQPLCPCGEIATDADHIVRIEAGGEPWARANIQALCHPCHSVKTNAEMRGQG